MNKENLNQQWRLDLIAGSPAVTKKRHQPAAIRDPSLESRDNFFSNVVHCGDCVPILGNLPDNCIDVVITSPPYFQQRKYTSIGVGQENSIRSYLDSLLECFSELVRVTKPTGSILYNIGDKIDKHKGTQLIPYRFALAALDLIGDLSLLNNITWIKKNPVPRQFSRRLVSSTEPFFHFVKSNKYFYDVDNFMVPAKKQSVPNPSDKLGEKYIQLIKTSSLNDSEKKAAVNAVNLAAAEVKSGEIAGFRIKIRGIHAPAFGGNDGGRKTQIETKGFTVIKLHGRPMKKDAIDFSVETIKGVKHPAIFPLLMIEEFIKLTCPAGGVVLDPYCGSGTTLLAAKNQKRDYMGIDVSPEYCMLAKNRLKL